MQAMVQWAFSQKIVVMKITIFILKKTVLSGSPTAEIKQKKSPCFEEMLRNTLLKSCMFHTSCQFNSQSAKVMKKILGNSRKRKFFQADTPILPVPSEFSKSSFENKLTGSSKRSNVLNKLFMRHITDLMATGECSAEILGLGIEVNRVKITADYKILKVYWIAKGTDQDDDIEKILKKNAGWLRHELSQLRVMGEVPSIVFVKDKIYAKIVEVNNILAKADFGEDFTPTDPSNQLKSELELYMPLDANTRNKIEALEDSSENEIGQELALLPPMAQNVLGLDHGDIMKRLKRELKKSEAPHRRNAASDEGFSWSQFKINQQVNNDPVAFENQNAQREAFKAFLIKRQIMQSKMKKLEHTWRSDEYLKEESRQHYLKQLENMKFDSPDDDFIIEEEFNHTEEYER